MKSLFIICLFMLLSACSSKSEPRIENSYAQQAQKLTAHGLDALHHGRLVSAEKSLQRALRSAWLSSDLSWVARSQYHIGALSLAQAKYDFAESMLIKARDNAEKTGSQLTLWRSIFAMALLHQRQGLEAVQLPELQKEMPVDVYLSAARLAHLQLRLSDAEQAYNYVVNQPLSTSDTLYNQAQAYLGLALLARDKQQKDIVLKNTNEVLALSKQAGFPLLAAHALLLQGTLSEDSGKLERAWKMYLALGDVKGQFDSLQLLLKLAELAKDKQRMHQWQNALKSLK